MPYRFDDSRWPVVICEMVGVSTDAEIDEFIRTVAQALSRRVPHYVIIDARRGESMSSKHRRQIADWVTRNQPELRAHRVGLALVAESALIRGALTAIYWLHAPPYPTKVFARIEEAEAWGHELLEQAAPAR
jgi:hypothetical protein